MHKLSVVGVLVVASLASAGPKLLTIGQASASGNLDKAIIRRHIKRNLQKIQYCYEKQLQSTPNLKGTVTVEFTIGVTGVVISASGTGVHPDVATCVASVVQAIVFPRPSGGEVHVNYPFVFRPAGDDAKPPKPAPKPTPAPTK